MNPGGLRADLLGTAGDPRVLTYRQAADVQPFANTLVTMDLTGAQIKTILEQQWQRDADGNIPSRPFLRLGTSEGFTSTYDAGRPEGDRITGMWLDGTALDPARTYRVAATSFLASGTGDNFWGFAEATNEQDTGKTDLQGVVDYLAEFAEHGVDSPLPVDYRQHAVGVAFPAGAPAAYAGGRHAGLRRVLAGDDRRGRRAGPAGRGGAGRQRARDLPGLQHAAARCRSTRPAPRR